jgi:hypothetical protein
MSAGEIDAATQAVATHLLLLGVRIKDEQAEIIANAVISAHIEGAE